MDVGLNERNSCQQRDRESTQLYYWMHAVLLDRTADIVDSGGTSDCRPRKRHDVA